MKKSTVYFVLLVLFDVVSIVVAEGSIVEIRGVIACLIFAVPFVLNIVFMTKCEKLLHKLLLSFMMLVYLLTGAVFLIRENSRTVISQTKNNRYIYVTYEINPGAMGHLSYVDKDYYSLIDTDLLTVRIVKSSEHYRYRG